MVGHCRAGKGGSSVGKAKRYCANDRVGGVKLKPGSLAPKTSSKKPTRGVAKAYVKPRKLKTKTTHGAPKTASTRGNTHTRFT